MAPVKKKQWKKAKNRKNYINIYKTQTPVPLRKREEGNGLVEKKQW